MENSYETPRIATMERAAQHLAKCSLLKDGDQVIYRPTHNLYTVISFIDGSLDSITYESNDFPNLEMGELMLSTQTFFAKYIVHPGENAYSLTRDGKKQEF